ncbi:MAG: hypothetical protein WCZ66_09915 [Sphingomonadaceae bacterium]
MADADDTHIARLKNGALTLAVKLSKSFHAFARALYTAHWGRSRLPARGGAGRGDKRRALDVSGEQTEHVGWTRLQTVAHMNQPRESDLQMVNRLPTGVQGQCLLSDISQTIAPQKWAGGPTRRHSVS